MLPRLPVLLVAALALALAACGSAAGPSGAAPSISDAWARPAAADGQSAAYLTINNTSDTADALLSASSPGAIMVELHETATDGSGMTGMQPVARLDIPAGASVELKPGGHHLMLMGLAGELTVGETIELDLVFEHAGKVVVMAEIQQG
jgi:periplasmic copper chaperone A